MPSGSEGPVVNRNARRNSTRSIFHRQRGNYIGLWDGEWEDVSNLVSGTKERLTCLPRSARDSETAAEKYTKILKSAM